MLQKISDDYKGKISYLEKIQNELSSSWTEVLDKVKVELGTKDRALVEMEAVMQDLSLRHALVIRTLYSA